MLRSGGQIWFHVPLLTLSSFLTRASRCRVAATDSKCLLRVVWGARGVSTGRELSPESCSDAILEAPW